jgi:hypothetical protein
MRDRGSIATPLLISKFITGKSSMIDLLPLVLVISPKWPSTTQIMHVSKHWYLKVSEQHQAIINNKRALEYNNNT